MQDFVPFQFDNFIEGEKSPVFDLSLNRPKDDNNLLADINAKLQILLEDRNNQNIKLIKMVLAEIAPALAKNCSNEIINDFISRRFPDWAKQKVLDIYIPENAVSSVKDNLEKLAVQNGSCPEITVWTVGAFTQPKLPAKGSSATFLAGFLPRTRIFSASGRINSPERTIGRGTGVVVW